MKKRIFLSLFLCVNFVTIASDIEPIKKHKIEFMVAPFGIYNSCHVGYTRIINSNLENKISIGSEIRLFGPRRFSLNISNSTILKLRETNLYVPILIRIKNARREIGYEEGYFPHYLRYTLGSGIGFEESINSNWGIRLDAIAGVSINLTNAEGNFFPYKFNFYEYQFDSNYPQYNPKLIPAFRVRLALTRCF